MQPVTVFDVELVFKISSIPRKESLHCIIADSKNLLTSSWPTSLTWILLNFYKKVLNLVSFINAAHSVSPQGIKLPFMKVGFHSWSFYWIVSLIGDKFSCRFNVLPLQFLSFTISLCYVWFLPTVFSRKLTLFQKILNYFKKKLNLFKNNLYYFNKIFYLLNKILYLFKKFLN